MHRAADETLDRIDEAVAQARARADRAREYRDRLELLRADGRSRGGAAGVTLGPTGAVLDVHLGRGLHSASLERIRAELLDANAAARAELAERVVALTGQAFGEDSATTREIATRYREMLAPPVDDGPGPAGVLR